MGVIRNRSLIEVTLKKYLKKKPKPRLYMALQVGVYQIGWMREGGMPDHAITHPLVEMVKGELGQKQGDFCNAVLRNILRDGLYIPQGNSTKQLAIRYSHPEWLVKKWLKENGQHVLIKRLEHQNKQADTWIRINKKSGTLLNQLPDEVTHELGDSVFDTYHQVTGSLGALIRSPAFSEGLFSVQDPASFLMFQLLNPVEGDIILDACAAPGGKTAMILEQMGDTVQVVAADLKPKRLLKLSDLANRLHLHSYQKVAMDARQLPFKKTFNKILIDAPCSNMGVLARRPEAKWNVTPQDIVDIATIQLEILEECSHYCEPGGIIVYATCSPESEECDEVIETFLKNHSHYVLDDAEQFVDTEHVSNHMVKIIPGQSPFDGFFGARLRRVS